MKSLILSLAAMVLLTSPVAALPDLYELETEYIKPLDACRQDRFSKACKQELIAALEQKLTQAPDDYDTLLLLGSKILAGNEQARPITLLSHAISLQPQRPEAWAARADQFSGLKLFPQALADAEEALRRNPDYADAWWIKADIHVERAEPEAAIQAYTRLIELSPEASAYYQRAYAYLDMGQAREAEADLKQACARSEWVSYCKEFWEGESEAILDQVIIKLAGQLRQAQTELARLKQIREVDPDNEAKSQAVTDYLLTTHNLYLKHLWAMLDKYEYKYGADALQALIKAHHIDKITL